MGLVPLMIFPPRLICKPLYFRMEKLHRCGLFIGDDELAFKKSHRHSVKSKGSGTVD